MARSSVTYWKWGKAGLMLANDPMHIAPAKMSTVIKVVAMSM